MSSVIHVTQAYYPESDGKPMGETDEHRDEMIRHIELLKGYYQGQDVYVSGNLLVYYEQGNPKKCVVPDTFVVKGISPQKRRIYKTWVEGRVPDVVFETTSRKTRRKDTEEKPQLYASLGIKEYFLFDPDREYLEPPLQGYRLADGKYAPIQEDTTGSLVSQGLQVRLISEGGLLQFYRLDNGERLLTPHERAEFEAQRAKQESKRAKREAKRAQQHAEHAARETAARLAAEAAKLEAEAEVARLRAELARRPPA